MSADTESLLEMTSTCDQILEDRVWQELATPALRGFLANGVAFRGKVPSGSPHCAVLILC
jgi:hypothetical protein